MRTALSDSSQHQTFAVGDIQPNPFRDLASYPLRPEKVEQLRGTLQLTGFWGNLVARLREDGKPELAYGHHRLEALRQEFGPKKQVSLVIQDLDDEQMLKIMCSENDEGWNTTARDELELAQAVVQAFGDGKIKLPPPNPKAPRRSWRYAPSFRQGHVPESYRGDRESPPKAYTATSVAEYLGWTFDKAQQVLAALELVEEGLISAEAYDGLSHSRAASLTSQVRGGIQRKYDWAKKFQKQALEMRKWAREAERAGDADARKAHEEMASIAEQHAADVYSTIRTDVDDAVPSPNQVFPNPPTNVEAKLKPLRRWSRYDLEPSPDRIALSEFYGKQPRESREPDEVRIYLNWLAQLLFVIDHASACAKRFSEPVRKLVVERHEEVRREMRELENVFYGWHSRHPIDLSKPRSILEWVQGDS